MAKKNTTKNATVTDDEITGTDQERHEKRISLLQDTMDDIAARVNDGQRSFTVRAIRARSVSLKVKLAALDAIQEALDESRAAITAAAEATDETAAPVVSRVSLLAQ